MIGFIGTGTMGTAVATVVRANTAEKLCFANRSVEKATALSDSLDGIVSTNQGIARNCQWIFFGVKPQMLPEVLTELREILLSRQDKPTLVSMAAGVTLHSLSEMIDLPWIRMMPNTALLYQQGVTVYCGTAKESSQEQFASWLQGSGVVDAVPEGWMDVCSALSGSGPAFCAMMVEAMADGAVRCGLPRDKAYAYGAQTLLGTGAMVQGGMLPSVIKDQVCSPAGSTIRGVATLEEQGFRSGVIEAIYNTYQRNQELGKKK